jgi:hypothetical protein
MRFVLSLAIRPLECFASMYIASAAFLRLGRRENCDGPLGSSTEC